MRSKMALKRIGEELYLIVPRFAREELLNPIEKDLERLETLELNLDSEKYHLINENANLRNRVGHLEASCKIQMRENKKLKKAIEILKKELHLTFGKETLSIFSICLSVITQQEYDLLKEVLGE